MFGGPEGTLLVNPANVSQLSGAGTVAGFIDPPFVDSFPVFRTWQMNHDNNNQFFVSLPSLLSFTARISSAPAFAQRSITERAKVGGLAMPRGRITEADRHDKFLLTVNWGDGTVTRHTFPPGSDGRLVEVTHRYRKPSPEGRPYKVTAAWSDPHGAGSSAEFAVEVVKRGRSGRCGE